MIVSDTDKFCFVSMPKTGTHTFYKVLQKRFDGYRYGRYHERVLPDMVAKKGYEIFTTVRHPLERFVSAYNSLLNTDDYRPIFVDKIGSDSFEDFTHWVCTQVSNTEVTTGKGFPVICTQSSWLKHLPIQAKIRIEHVNTDFWDKLNFPNRGGKPEFEFPVELKREHDPFEEMVTYLAPYTFKRLMDWLEPDFEYLAGEYDF